MFRQAACHKIFITPGLSILFLFVWSPFSACFSNSKAWVSSATSSAIRGCCVKSLHRKTREIAIWPTPMCGCPAHRRAPPTLPAVGNIIKGAHSLQNYDLSVHSIHARSFLFQQRAFHLMSFVAAFFFRVCVHMSVGVSRHWEMCFLSTLWVLEIELRSSDLVACARPL